MLDDSWDSVSSSHSNDYKIKNKTTAKSVTTSKTKNIDKYNFPSPLYKRNTVQLDNSFDNDIIFSPTNSQGTTSMLPSPNENKKMFYANDDSPEKKDYLANFITNSADLEDSILGELLGGGKKKSTTNLPRPPESSSSSKSNTNMKIKTSSSSPNKSKLQSIETEKSQKGSDKSNVSTRKSRNKSPLSRKETQNSPTKSFKSSTFQDHSKLQSSNKFDESFDKDSELNSPYGRSIAGNNSPYESNNEDNLKSNSNKDNYTSSYIPSYNSNKEQTTTNASNNISEDNNDDNVTGLSFIPSFMEQGRQNRRRRNLDAPLPTTNTTNNSEDLSNNKLDDLDRALGIGLPATTTKKTITDPFSAVEKKLPLAISANLKGTTAIATEGGGGNGFHIDMSDDSSSDDAILRRSRQKEYFPIATKIVNNNHSNTNTAYTNNKNTIVEASRSITSDVNNTVASTMYASKPQHQAVSSLPTISRSPIAGSSIPLASNNNTKVNSILVDPVHLKDDYDDNEEDELDISGIVRMNIDDDLLTNALQTSNKKDRNNFQKSKPVIINNKNTTGSYSISSPNKQDVSSELPLSPRYNSSWNKTSYNTNVPGEVIPAPPTSNEQPQSGHLAVRTSLTSLDNNNPTQEYLPGSNDSGIINSMDNKDLQIYKRTTEYGLVRDRSNTGNNNTIERELPHTLQYNYNTMKNKSTTSANDANITYFEQASIKVDENNYSNYTKSSNQIAQQLHNERESLEMQQLKDVEMLKLKLLQTNNMIDRADKDSLSINNATSQPVDVNQLNHYRYIQETNIHYAQENIEQKRTIAYLESEISRLKDEANIKALRNQEDILRLKANYEAEISDVKLKSAIEIESLERRHDESITSLRKLHDNEIQSIKERFKSEEKFDQIAGQLRSTSGSIRFIEEQLQSRQKGVEAIREGQIDARERLLSDMEEKARERAELAEAEGYRLKGILSHMEHVVNTLREQGSEERERLRLEHSRIQARQQSFESEKTALQQRNMEELNYIKQRSKEVEIELLKLTQEKQAHYETQSAIQYKLDSEKSEFAIYYKTKTKSLEIFEARLKEEEARLNRLRDAINKEKHELDERKENAMREIESAEELHRLVLQGKEQNENKHNELMRLSQSYKHASEDISHKEVAINEQMSALQEKELAIREGFAQLKLAASELAQRERELQHTTHYMERKKIAMDKSDNDLQAKKLAVASSFREWSSKQGEFKPNYRDNHNVTENPNSANDVPKLLDTYNYGKENVVEGLMPQSSRSNDMILYPIATYPTTTYPIHASHYDMNTIIPPPPYPGTTAATATNHNTMNNYLPVVEPQISWIDSFQTKLQINNPSGGIIPVGNGVATSRLPIELRNAQSTLKQYKNQINKINHSSVHIQKLINDENDFVKALQNKNKTLTI